MPASNFYLTDGTLACYFSKHALNFGTLDSNADVMLTGDNIWGADQMALEPVEMYAQQGNPDGLAAELQNLHTLVREAQNNRRTLWQLKPVYLVQQINETNARYALVYDIPDWDLGEVFSEMMSRGQLRKFTIHLLREHPWRELPPGVLPSPEVLNTTDGPTGKTQEFISNFIDNIAVAHAYNYQQAVTLPVFDVAAAGATGASGNASCSITPGAHSNEFMLVGVWAVGAAAPTCTVTSNKTGTVVFIKDFGAGVIANSTFQLWGIINPQQALTTVTATLGTNTGWAMYAIDYYNVDQSNPLFNLIWGNAVASPISNVDAGGAYTLTVDGIMVYASGGTPTITVQGAQTSRENFAGPTNYKMGASELAGAASVTMGWTSTGITGAIQFVASLSPVMTYSADLAGNTAATLLPASPAVGDGLVVIAGSVGPLKQIVFPIATALAAAAITFAIDWSLTSNGNTFYGTAAVLGTASSLLPTATTLSTLFGTIDDYAVLVQPQATNGSITINSQTGFTIRIRITAVTALTVRPVLGAAIYAQTKNYLEFPSTAFVGDARPVLDLRMQNPMGGGTSPNLTTPSRIIFGSKSLNIGAGQFVPDIPCNTSGVTLTGWTPTAGTDTSALADPTAPYGSGAHITFATDATLKTRVTLVGALMTRYYAGRYRVFARVRQNAGANGDTYVSLRTQIGGSTTAFPQYTLPTYTLQQHDADWEIADLTGDGYLSIPFGGIVTNDSLAQDLDFLLSAARNTGISTLDVSDIILMPISEMAQELRDPVSDTTYGASALRGNCQLDDDAGVLLNRCVKMNSVGGVFQVAETWIRNGDFFKAEPNVTTRIYFLILHYPTTWGVGPFVASVGSGLRVSLYGHSTYQSLRGAG